jgi:hypothetical protein
MEGGREEVWAGCAVIIILIISRNARCCTAAKRHSLQIAPAVDLRKPCSEKDAHEPITGV